MLYIINYIKSGNVYLRSLKSRYMCYRCKRNSQAKLKKNKKKADHKNEPLSLAKSETAIEKTFSIRRAARMRKNYTKISPTCPHM